MKILRINNRIYRVAENPGHECTEVKLLTEVLGALHGLDPKTLSRFNKEMVDSAEIKVDKLLAMHHRKHRCK